MLRFLFPLGVVLFAAVIADVKPVRQTVSESQQTDDPAVWVNAANPSKSLILGTVKMAAPDGGVSVYRLDGSKLMTFTGVDRPNNVDVGYGLQLGGRKIDVAVVTERNQHCLRIFEIVPEVGIRDLASIPVFAGETQQAGLPMGIATYRGPRGLYAIVSRKNGPTGRYLWQYLLHDDGSGKLVGEKVREFGRFSGSKEIEAIAVDQELGYVYYSDEGVGIRKYHADPLHPDATKELALFATTGWHGDREGIAIYQGKRGKGFIVATSQQAENSEFHVFAREGSANNPHDHSRELGVFRVGAGTTDGIEICSRSLGPEFPNGLFIGMNDKHHNFILTDWRSVTSALGLKP